MFFYTWVRSQETESRKDVDNVSFFMLGLAWQRNLNVVKSFYKNLLSIKIISHQRFHHTSKKFPHSNGQENDDPIKRGSHGEAVAQKSSGELAVTVIDQSTPGFHIPIVYFYRSNGSTFGIISLFKEALAKALVLFYPMAGRLHRGENGRFDVVCNDEGALFVEAETDATVDDLGEFTPSMELNRLVPIFDHTDDICTYPVLAVQVTRFKCGGVCLGICFHHYIADGHSFIHFVNSWSNIARKQEQQQQINIKIQIPPSIDRSILRPRYPPRPIHPHVEYHPPPPIIRISSNESPPPPSISTSLLKVTRPQLDFIKAKSNTAITTSTSFVALASHVWQCVTRARDLQDNQDTKLVLVYDGRQRLRPPIGYFGNVMFLTSVISKAGNVRDDYTSVLARKVGEGLIKMSEDYLRSAMDYLELEMKKVMSAILKDGFVLYVNSWERLPAYDADFGFGKPIFVGPANMKKDLCILLPKNPTGDDGSVYFAIALEDHQMLKFKEFIYELYPRRASL